MLTEGFYGQAYKSKADFLRIVANETENLRTVHDVELDLNSLGRKLEGTFQSEVLIAQEEQKPLDVLELCSGEILGKMGLFLSAQDFSTDPLKKTEEGENDSFWDQQEGQAVLFLDKLEVLAQNGNPDSVADFLSANRKMIGFCTDFSNLKRLGQIISSLYVEGLLEKDIISIAHYPGSFHPFPHIGHVEVAESVIGTMTLADLKHPRVVVTTVTRTDDKSLDDNFSSRVDNLIRGFADSRDVSVLGVASDLVKQDEVIDLRRLIAKLDSHGKERHVMGSDTLISRIAKAREGDLLSNYLINSGGTLFLSVRTMDEYKEVLDAVNAINNEFDSQLIILPDPKHHLSGTMVRALNKDMQRIFLASMHIKP